METIDKNQTIDETKEKLKKSREELEGELEVQLQDIKKDAADVGKQILLVGGGIWLSWRLLKGLRSLTRSKEEKKKIQKRKRQKKMMSGGNSNKGFGNMILHGVVATAFSLLNEGLKQSIKDEHSVNDPR